MNAVAESVVLPEKYVAVKKELEEELGKRLKVTVRADLSVDKNGMLSGSVFTANPRFNIVGWEIATIEHQIDGPTTDHYDISTHHKSIPGAERAGMEDMVLIRQWRQARKTLNEVQEIIANIIHKDGSSVLVHEYVHPSHD